MTVDGVVGQLDIHCPANYTEAVVSKGGRACVLTIYGGGLRPLLLSMLATVRLTPETAKN